MDLFTSRDSNPPLLKNLRRTVRLSEARFCLSSDGAGGLLGGAWPTKLRFPSVWEPARRLAPELPAPETVQVTRSPAVVHSSLRMSVLPRLTGA